MRWRRIIPAALVAVFFVAGSLFFISRSECFQLVGDVTCRVETDRKIVALTFDDGPTRQGIDAVLPVLDRYGVKATFFLIGNEMEKHPDLAERLLADGHELGNHSYSHKRNVLRQRSFYRDEVRRTQRLLADAGSDTTLFRPPYGKRLIGLPLEVEAAGYRMVTWDVKEDGRLYDDPDAYVRDILARVRPGSIILIHPMYRINATGREALPAILAGLKAKGYEIVPVGQLLAFEQAGKRSPS